MFVQVHPGSLQDAARGFEAQVQELEGVLSQVRGEIEVLGSRWTGTGFDSFANATQNWDRTTNEVKTVLQEVLDNLKAAGMDYDNLDNAIASAFKKLTI